MAGPLGSVPGLGGFLESEQLGQQQQMGQLQQMGALQGILAKARAAQEGQQIKGVLAQTGGDPTKAIEALLRAGTPASLGLAAKLQGMLPKPATDRVVAPGGALVDPTGKVKYQAPFKPKKDAGTWSEPYQLGGATVQKNTTTGQIRTAVSQRQPGVTVNMPASSDLMQKADGSYVRVRIGKDGKVEEVPLGDVRPPESPTAARAAEDKAGEAVTLSNVKSRVAKMASLIQGGGIAGGVVGPLGMASRIGETAVGAVQPGAPTPALDYQNEMRLLLSDVRKMVEKDPNLSKDEREAMYETLGGGFMQTPGSAMRTLTNIITHVESKQRSGPSRPTGNALAQQVQAAGWAYEPGKYNYRVVDGKVQRKAK